MECLDAANQILCVVSDEYLGQFDEWDVLSLPAIAYFDETIPLSNNRMYLRKSGEALSPEREPLHVLDALKLQIGSDAFSAQY